MTPLDIGLRSPPDVPPLLLRYSRSSFDDDSAVDLAPPSRLASETPSTPTVSIISYTYSLY